MTTEEALAALGRYASDEDRERAIEHVRRMADVVEAGREDCDCHTVECRCGLCRALEALDGGGR